MKNIIPLLMLLMTCSLGCAQGHQEEETEDNHRAPTHNFTIMRIIILNDQNELLMGRDEDVWATPYLMFEKRQYLQEGLDSLAAAFGIRIDKPELRGYFGYKYEYHPYATMRSYFLARYIEGDIRIPSNADEVRWVSMDEAIEMINVTSIQQITRQILKNPKKVWGGSFMVYRDGKTHPTEMIEPFYSLLDIN